MHRLKDFLSFLLTIIWAAAALYVNREAIAQQDSPNKHQSRSIEKSFFARVMPGRPFSFPRDHNIHTDFQTEWWYVTANLHGEDGLDYGAQFTLFRTCLVVAGTPQPLFFAHAALTTPTEFYHAERFARADMGHGGVESEPWLAFLDHWEFSGTGASPLPGKLTVMEKDFGYQLNLAPSPYFLQGDDGFSQKDAHGNFASYYYSAPFIKIDGEIQFEGTAVKVSGEAWFDREWSSTSIIDGTLGWDWLSLHLDDNTALMLYQVRSGGESHVNGAIMKISGEYQKLSSEKIGFQPQEWAEFNGEKYPVIWRVSIPSEQIALTVTPINRNQFMAATTQYWEGAVRTAGSHSATGYLELFGYHPNVILSSNK